MYCKVVDSQRSDCVTKFLVVFCLALVLVCCGALVFVLKEGVKV